MGLTNGSVGMNAAGNGGNIKKRSENDKVIAIAGNPNVGKSTVFNGLTGMNQHTGNWPGKTVTSARGYCSTEKNSYVLVDIPGTYSLMAHSAEEEIARDFICFSDPDATVVVCDATCLERNMNLVLQTLEISSRTVVCVNLMDEAKRKHISVDFDKLSERLHVPVIGVTARSKRSLKTLTSTLDEIVKTDCRHHYKVNYPQEIEKAISVVEKALLGCDCGKLNKRWVALKLLENDFTLVNGMKKYVNFAPGADEKTEQALSEALSILASEGISPDVFKDTVVSSLVSAAEDVCAGAVIYEKKEYANTDRKLDKIFTSRITGYPVMLLLLAVVFWLTIVGANYPSELIADFLFRIQDKLTEFFVGINAPEWLHGMLVLGVYRVLAWVVSVMLPPMAIFFPLFTLLEDSGYLPRVAYNLDKPFKKCNACGKQALTMCMGFGCNAAGIVGCRIIDSPRERLLAILTNNFVPCNGRFPTLIAILTMFFVGASAGSSVLSALLLTAVIVLGVAVTLWTTKLLSRTLLKGVPSSFTLELPPYRKPQIGKVIVRSIFDRTLFVLARAVAVAAPAGLVIWAAANVNIDGVSILTHCAQFLDPFARLMGLDGVILMAFILGFSANETVIPIMIMAYTAQGSILQYESLFQLKDLFVQNGWTWVTAICTMLFMLMHWPCSTALITVKKETGSMKWTLLAAAIPTVIGVAVCIAVRTIATFLGI